MEAFYPEFVSFFSIVFPVLLLNWNKQFAGDGVIIETAPHHVVVILDGSSEHGAHIWSNSGISNLLKAFERVVKSDIFSEKTYFTTNVLTIF